MVSAIGVHGHSLLPVGIYKINILERFSCRDDFQLAARTNKANNPNWKRFPDMDSFQQLRETFTRTANSLYVTNDKFLFDIKLR